MKFKIAFFALTLMLLFTNRGLVWAQDDTADGYRGQAWGTSLKSFKAATGSKAASFVERVEARAIDYLMMDFHEVDPADNNRSTKLNDQRIPGDRGDYVFYDGQYRVAVEPIDPANESAVRSQLDQKYKTVATKSYTTQWDFKPAYGWQLMGYDFREYQKSAATRVYFVEASSFLEDGALEDEMGDTGIAVHTSGSSTPVAGFLIYVSDDYLKGSDNAWADYQTNKQTSPERVQAAKEARRQQDLSSIE